MELGTKVYILGAGCSAGFGYPLGNGFVQALDSFGQTLTAPDKQQVKRAVERTVELLQSRSIATLDELVARVNDGVFDEGSHSFVQKEQKREERIYEAKIATVALFLSLEPAALKTGLASYSNLLREILPGHDHWMRRLETTSHRILSFNYDRLFEMAFLQLFRS